MKNIKSNEVSVLLIGPFNEPFDYLIENNISGVRSGQIVLAPLGSRKIVGMIVSEGSKKYPVEKLKKILKIYNLNTIPLPSIELIYFLASWNCVYKGLVLKMVLSPLDAITSPKFKIIYKNNLLNSLDIETIDNKKIRSKRKLVLDILLNEEKGKSAEDLINETRISKSIINDMLKKGLIKEEFFEIVGIVPFELFQENKIENHNVKLLNEQQEAAIGSINISIKESKPDCFFARWSAWIRKNRNLF